MKGKRYGRLTVECESAPYIEPKRGKRHRQWECRCDCGGTAVVMQKKLRSGHTRSCGCLQRDTMTRHGHNRVAGKSATYRIWDAMLQRCHNPASTKYAMYGGRGIRVCDRWHSFKNFLADMGERPSADLSIDRVDNNRGYEPGNCRWATRKGQQRNMRRNHIVEYRGRTMCVAEAAELAGVNANSLYPHLNHGGLTIDQAIQRVGG